MRPAPLPLVTLLHAALARTAPAHLPARRCLRTFARLPTTPAPSIIRRSLPLRSFHASAPLRKDLYEVLGVSKTAEQKDIKSAYYTLAKKYHPDANPGNKEAAKRFQEISEAYSVLSNESERARYDRNPSGMNEQGGFDANNFRDMSGFGSPEDLFAHLFGGRANSFGGGFGFNNMRSQHIETSVNLSFEESVQGCAKNVEYKGQIACEPCKGSGGKDGKPSKSKCTKCNGSGYEIGTMNGFLQYRTACSRCQGSGQSISNPCPVRPLSPVFAFVFRLGLRFAPGVLLPFGLVTFVGFPCTLVMQWSWKQCWNSQGDVGHPARSQRWNAASSD
eukprot:m.121002 g.121002  ORF g.121002 m.121002 type:complete len:333 (-) comp52089_c0_seq40:1279-2277(-)